MTKTNKENRPRIAIIYGGKSCEHDISVITACLVKGCFDGELFSIYITKDNRAYLVGNDWLPRDHVRRKLRTQVVFLNGESAVGIVRGSRVIKQPLDVAVNCCHGINGEDGCVAALCRMCGVPLVGSDVAASAVAMDKVLTKQLLNANGFPTVEGRELRKTEDISVLDGMEYPLIVKPALLGSSVGVSVAHSPDELKKSLKTAFDYCGKVLVERALVHFSEFNCAAFRDGRSVVTSNVDSPVTVNELLTFNDKYIQNNAKRPLPLSEERKAEIKSLTAEIYRKLSFGGVIRVDFLSDNDAGKLYVNEINTTPGSLALGLWESVYTRRSYGEALVRGAVADYRELQTYTYTFPSAVLNGGGIKKK